ncbi:alginate O-acetyltransferase [Candidatus Daviesbacteria bacterium RIFCSPLOWO2_02_FULL_41_8]|uniref:Alginate O-acetyltransferase n=1 Tax=Candidatus Daviesbacteria bacterium RIFCSPLOWO2_02_FULL_41_8 TaxID=1797798 RepID=A0A1F5NLX9_9BACT|nr:MAG: alginate O-acetyltransferase [Candidatus Daviesbacteria bacterium RIFCSPLOWO2_02_FULL_41_8]
MLFNSFEFLIFFPIVTALYFLLPHRFRWFMLLIASVIFYMAFIPWYILILLITILIDYSAGIFIERSGGKKKKTLLVVSIISTCTVLFVFKYFNFFGTNLNVLSNFIGWNYSIGTLKLILPIGLSFHTFQSLSYVIEVYRGHQKAEYHFGIYALYVMFYPQLVAGPIERPQNLLHQFYEKHDFDYKRVTDGLKLMLWGLFKKIVIADRLAVFVSQVYNNPTGFEGISLITATVFFAFQIYCDFSGYSDIGIGAAQVMGFKLMDNFKRPYFSKSISEFWKRWHISLSTWFRDYFYFSIGGNRVSIPRWYFNLFATFLLSGFWHGANWTFIFWGALHGFYLIFGIMTSKIRTAIAGSIYIDRFPAIYKLVRVSLTFILVSFAWIFFRVNNISDAFYIITHLHIGVIRFTINLFSNLTAPSSGKLAPFLLGQHREEFFIAIVALGFMEFVHSIQRHGSIRHMLSGRPIWFRWSIYYILIFAILFFGVFSKTPFIYFQF